MSRLFDGVDDSMAYLLPSTGQPDLATGLSLLVLTKIAITADNTWMAFIECKHVSGISQATILRRSTGNMAYSDGAGVDDVISITDSDGWMIMCITKAAGSAIPQFHKLPIGGSRTSAAAPEGVRGDPNTLSTGTIYLGGSTSDWANMYLGAAAVFDYQLTTTQLDGILAAKTTNAILALGPAWCADDADGFASDLVGNADRTGLTGTTSSGDNPSGWVYGSLTDRSGTALLHGGGAQTIVKSKNVIATHG